MAITMYNNAEGGSNGTTVTTTNAGGTGNSQFSQVIGAVTFATASVQHGTLGFHFAPTSGASCRVRWAGFNDVTGVLRVYKTSDSTWTVSDTILAVQTSGGAGVISVWATTGGKYNLQGSGGVSLTTTTSSRAANDRIEMSWTVGTSTSNGSFDFYLYRGDSTTATEHLSSTTANLGTANWDRIDWGKTSTSTSTNVIDYDDLALASGTTTLFGPNTGPVASFTATPLGLSASFDATASASTTSITSYAWNFGDAGTGTGVTTSHTYATAGTYTVTLTVTDSNSQTATTTRSVTVAAPASNVTPISLITTTGWTGVGTDVLTAITDTDSTTFVLSPDTPTNSLFRVRLGALTAPAAGTDMTVTVQADMTTATTGTLSAALYEGSTQRASAASQSLTLVTAGTAMVNTLTFTFPAASIANVTSWNALDLALTANAS